MGRDFACGERGGIFFSFSKTDVGGGRGGGNHHVGSLADFFFFCCVFFGEKVFLPSQSQLFFSFPPRGIRTKMGRKGRRSNGTEKKGFSFGLSRAFMRVKELKCSVQHLISRSSFEFARLLLLLLRRRRSRRPWPRPLSQPGGRRGPSSQFSQVSKRGEIMFRETFFVGYFFSFPFFWWNRCFRLLSPKKL